MLSADLVHRQIALLAGGEFFERRVVPFREAVVMALDDRITESASKVALLAAALTRLPPALISPEFPHA